MTIFSAKKLILACAAAALAVTQSQAGTTVEAAYIESVGAFGGVTTPAALDAVLLSPLGLPAYNDGLEGLGLDLHTRQVWYLDGRDADARKADYIVPPKFVDLVLNPDDAEKKIDRAVRTAAVSTFATLHPTLDSDHKTQLERAHSRAADAIISDRRSYERYLANLPRIFRLSETLEPRSKRILAKARATTTALQDFPAVDELCRRATITSFAATELVVKEGIPPGLALIMGRAMAEHRSPSAAVRKWERRAALSDVYNHTEFLMYILRHAESVNEIHDLFFVLFSRDSADLSLIDRAVQDRWVRPGSAQLWRDLAAWKTKTQSAGASDVK